MENNAELTQEQINENRKKMIEYYESVIPFYQKQLEYESLLTSIQESKTRRVLFQAQIAQLMNSQEEPSKETKTKENE